MIRRLRLLVSAVLFAVLGAAAGRLAADFRRQRAAGEEPRLNPDRVELRPRDVVPGIVAAMRVSGRPWSWLHIPPWLAAFAVNFGIAAYARELAPLGRAAGIDIGGADLGGADPGGTQMGDAGDAAADAVADGWPDAAEASSTAGNGGSARPDAGPADERPAAAEPSSESGFTAFAQ